MNNIIELQNEIIKHVTCLFSDYTGEDLCYHNLEHTKTVVNRATEIAKVYALSEVEMFIIIAGAWFHDTGQLTGSTIFHEDRSVVIMSDFMNSVNVEKEIIEKIESCICATKIPQHPKSLSDEIVCDADTYHLGTEEFIKTDKLLKQEFKLRNLSVAGWEEKTLKVLLNHQYFTPYCKELLSEGKQKNITKMLSVTDSGL